MDTSIKPKPEIKCDFHITIKWDGRTAEYVLPTVPFEDNGDLLVRAVAALIDLEQRVSELETARWE